MQAIYASKLYKASPRKEKIRAAIENPVNVELVTQLAEYLDEEYQQPQYLKKGYSENISPEQHAGHSGKSSGISNDNSSGGFSGGGGSSYSGSPSMNMDDVVLDKDGNPMEDPESAEGVVDNDENSLDSDFSESDLSQVNDDESIPGEGLEDVEEATNIHDNSLSSPLIHTDAERLDEPADDNSKEVILQNNVESIKTMLNATPDTAGVERLLIKDSEMWIYYNDYINLNNVMSPVIEFFNRGSFTYLEFNRLARSTNAIVFQICTNDTML